MVYLSEAAVAIAVEDCVAKAILASVSSAAIPVSDGAAAVGLRLTCACVDWPPECPQLVAVGSTRSARRVRYTVPLQCRTRRACTSCTVEPNAAGAGGLVA